MQQAVQPPARVSESDYLHMEEAAETKHEFYFAQLIDMAGASVAHVRIASNLTRQLGNRLDGKPCQALGSDLRIRIDESGNYVYPDVTVVCGPVQYARPNRSTTITNPQLIIEIVSPSTEHRDRVEKFDDYRRIESLQEYFLVSQDRPSIQSFYRQNDGVWAFGPSYTSLSQAIKLRSLLIEIPMSDIYAGIELPKPPANSESAG